MAHEVYRAAYLTEAAYYIASTYHIVMAEVSRRKEERASTIRRVCIKLSRGFECVYVWSWREY